MKAERLGGGHSFELSGVRRPILTPFLYRANIALTPALYTYEQELSQYKPSDGTAWDHVSCARPSSRDQLGPLFVNVSEVYNARYNASAGLRAAAA